MTTWKVLLISLCCLGAALAEGEVKSVVVLARHGARWSFSDEKAGEMTQNGLRMAYLQGQYLRQSYPKVFSSRFRMKEHRLFSSATNRTVQSGLALLQGLFDFGSAPEKVKSPRKFVLPPWKGAKQEGDFRSQLPHEAQVFPLHSARSDFNYVFDPYDWGLCPKNTRFSPSAKNRTKGFLELFNSFLPTLKAEKIPYDKWINGDQLERLEDWYLIYDAVSAGRYLGRLTISDEAYDKLEILYVLGFFIYLDKDTDRHRFYATFLLRRIKSLLLEMKQGFLSGVSEFPRFGLLMGHDLNLLTFLYLWGQTSYECLEQKFKTGRSEGPCFSNPPFASSLVLELKHAPSTKQFFVAAILNGKTLDLCKNECTFDEFIATTDSFTLQGSDPEILRQHCFAEELDFKRIFFWLVIAMSVVSTLLLVWLISLNSKIKQIKVM